MTKKRDEKSTAERMLAASEAFVFVKGRGRRLLTKEQRLAVAEQLESTLRWFPDALRFTMELAPVTVKEAIRRTKLGHRAAISEEKIDIVRDEYEHIAFEEQRKRPYAKHTAQVLHILVADSLNARGWALRFGQPITPRVVREILSR